MIDLRSQQMIQHVHGCGEQNALIGLAGFPSEDAGQEGFPHAGIADQYEVGTLAKEAEIEQTQDAILGLHTALVMVEVERVDTGLRLQVRTLEAAFDGTALARFQFQIGQQLDGSRDA